MVLGAGSLGDDPSVMAHAALGFAQHFPKATFLPALHRGNVMGALDMGLAPGLLPGRTPLGDPPGSWSAVPDAPGLDAEAMLRAASEGDIDVAILLGCDPLTDFPDATLAERGFNRVEHLIAVECVLNFTSTGADIVLPAAATASEVDGTFTNIEGRLSPLTRKVTAPGTARPDWMIAVELAGQLGSDLGFIDIDELWDDLAAASSLHAGVRHEAVVASGPDGVVLTGTSIERPETPDVDEPGEGELRLVVTRKMYDEGTMLACSPSLAGLAAGASAALHPERFADLGIAAGDEVVVSSPAGSITLPSHPDPGVARGSVAIEFNQANASAAQLLDSRRTVTVVSVEAGS